MATAIGCTEGQVWTVFLGLVVAAAVLGGGLPALSHHARDSEAAGLAPVPRASLDASSVGAAPVPDNAPPPDAALPKVSPLDTLTPAPSGAVPLPLSPAPTALESPPTTEAPAPSPPVRVVAAGWATASPTAGAAADPTVPSGALPVAAKGGSVDKVSFLRFSAAPGALRLVLVSGGPLTQQDDGTTAIQACVITVAQWTASDNASLASAPAYDCAHPVVLQHQADGAWKGDLSALGARAGADGVALVPVTAGVSTFQAVFARP